MNLNSAYTEIETAIRSATEQSDLKALSELQSQCSFFSEMATHGMRRIARSRLDEVLEPKSANYIFAPNKVFQGTEGEKK